MARGSGKRWVSTFLIHIFTILPRHIFLHGRWRRHVKFVSIYQLYRLFYYSQKAFRLVKIQRPEFVRIRGELVKSLFDLTTKKEI